MILGQSAGTSAALSIKEGVDILNLSYPDFKNQLIKDGQILDSKN